jgi:hypothetical protein
LPTTKDRKADQYPGFFVAIGHTPNSEIFKPGLKTMKPDILLPVREVQKQILKEYLPAGTFRIKFSGRPLQQPVQDAWLLSRRNDGWLNRNRKRGMSR